ncbi:IS66 family transposase, partial [Ralstonia solanacearum]
QSLFGKALHYLHGQWPKLTRYVENGAWPISNNPCENAIRPFVVGRRNWLFCDTVAGANASANLYSLVETAKANGVDPYRYLVAALKLLPKAQTADDYEALLPWNLTPEQSEFALLYEPQGRNQKEHLLLSSANSACCDYETSERNAGGTG